MSELDTIEKCKTDINRLNVLIEIGPELWKGGYEAEKEMVEEKLKKLSDK